MLVNIQNVNNHPFLLYSANLQKKIEMRKLWTTNVYYQLFRKSYISWLFLHIIYPSHFAFIIKPRGVITNRMTKWFQLTERKYHSRKSLSLTHLTVKHPIVNHRFATLYVHHILIQSCFIVQLSLRTCGASHPHHPC